MKKREVPARGRARARTAEGPDSKWAALAVGCVGAQVKYGCHNGWFTADIIRTGTHCVIAAGGPVTGDTLVRNQDGEVTHYLSEVGPMTGKGYDGATYWNPQKGIFVVPVGHVTVKPKDGR